MSQVDAGTIAAIARQIVDQELLLNWKFYLVLLAITLLASALSSFATSYFKSRGQHLATKADFDELLRQVRQTTEATESIKQSLSHQDWVTREFKTLRRVKLEELLNAVYETHHWLERRRTEALFSGEETTAPDPSARVEVIGGLYFPELGFELAKLRKASLEYEKWLVESEGKVKPLLLAKNVAGYAAAMSDVVKGANVVVESLLEATSVLENKAKSLMAKVLVGGDVK